ncbi:MAG: 50S ribosomal protein L11 methyltransferase [Bryobacteraceae bacterium]
MQVLVIRPNPSRRDYLVAELWEHGTAGILEDDSRLRAYFPDSVDTSGMVAAENGEIIDSLFETSIPNYQPNEANTEPVYLGQRFVVLAASIGCASSPHRTPLLLKASDAFGSGRHESTQLMVEAMESHIQPGSVTLDVGCGSGILSEVARHLGASTIVACDIHADAIRTTRETCTDAASFLGSVDAIEASVADVVLANISAKVIDAIAADLVRVTKPGGLLVLSGFIQDRTPERFRPEKVLERNGWLCWICRPELAFADAAESSRSVQPFETQWW